MHITVEKTKMLKIDKCKNEPIHIDWWGRYLGFMLEVNGSYNKEIRRRLAMGMSTPIGLKSYGGVQAKKRLDFEL